MESPILMAKAYPNCKFYGFDNHPASIEYARNKAREEGLDEDRIRFEVATNFPIPTTEGGNSNTSSNNDKQRQEKAEEGYDLIAFFDCLHDMEDPEGAAAHPLKTLKKP